MSLVAAVAAIVTMVTGCTASGSGSASHAPAGAQASGGASASARPDSTPASSTPASTSQPGAGLVTAAVAELKAGGSVHVNITSHTGGTAITFSQDSTATGGRQDMTFDGVGHATVLLISGVGYLQADEAGLMGFFGVSQADAARLTDKWISVRPGQKIGSTTYAQLTDGITLSSVASELAITGPYTAVADATVAGQHTFRVQGHVPASQKDPSTARETLNVTAAAPLRPVQLTLSGDPGNTDQITFSNWGEKLSIPVPPNAQPANSLGTPSLT
jgi:hypothetical protein